MTGHQALVAMRHAGRKPAYVWVSEFPGPIAEYPGDSITLHVQGETPELLDLRCLVGLTAIVEGDDPVRVERLEQACRAHAKRVVSNVIQRIEGRQTVTKTTDSEGVMTWQI